MWRRRGGGAEARRLGLIGRPVYKGCPGRGGGVVCRGRGAARSRLAACGAVRAERCPQLARGAMRRASRDYTKYLRGSEELGSGAAHESAPPPPPPAPLPAHPHPPAASRSLLAALVLLGLGQVVCSVALFLYFRAQVSGASARARRRWRGEGGSCGPFAPWWRAL